MNDGQEVDDTFGVTTLDGTQAQVVLKVIGQAAASSGGGTGGDSGTSSPLTEQERAILGAMLSEMAQSSVGAGSSSGTNAGSDAGLGQMLGRQDTDEDDQGEGEGEDDGLTQAAPVVNDLTEGARQWRAPSVEPQQSLPSAQQMLSRALSDAGGDTAQVLDQMPQPDIDGEAPPAEPAEGDEAPQPQARAAAPAEVAQTPKQAMIPCPRWCWPAPLAWPSPAVPALPGTVSRVAKPRPLARRLHWLGETDFFDDGDPLT